MNRKITFPQLAGEMAQLTSGSSSTAESFIKHLFDLIAEKLAKGESVTIKGIGTFSPADDPDYPVTWIPDKELAEAVNEPFAFFEAVPLGEGVTEDTLEEADSVLDTTAEIEESTAAIPVIPPVPVSPVIPPIPKSTPTPDHEEKIADSEATVATDEELELQSPTPEEPAAEVNEPETTVIEPTDKEESQEYDEYPEEERHSFNPWLAFAIGVITGALLYFVADRYLLPVTAAEETEIEEVETPVDSINDSVPALETPDTVAEAPADTVKIYEPIAIDTISTSRYLTTMARKYYGDYKFWVYIYEENSDVVTNPNRIRPGTTVKIPDPEKYGIDAKDPESLRRAEKKIGEISAQLAK